MSGRTTKAAENAKADLPRLMQALRDQGVTDPQVLKAIETTPRDLFTPDLFKDRSWEDSALPIACGQTISQPYVVAYMTEQLDVHPHHRVLEIGTGSGYQAAVLSRLAREVVSVERYRTLAESASARLTAQVPMALRRASRYFAGKSSGSRISTRTTSIRRPVASCSKCSLRLMPSVARFRAAQKLRA